MQVDFERERRWWDAKAHKEEQDRADEAINRALRWREIERWLDGVHTILEVGGGTGAFSIPLAQRGYEVTHVDLSPAMLEVARQKVGDLPNLRFVQANAVDLSQFGDGEFDLVLNMDGAISFCGIMAEKALLESCRLARRVLIASVTPRAHMLPTIVRASLLTTGELVPAVYEMWERGLWRQEQYPENERLAEGMTQNYMGVMRAFLPAELRAILEKAGMRVLRCGGLGSLSGLCGEEVTQRVLADKRLLETFLDLNERFDNEVLPDGPGTSQRAGLLAVAAPAANGRQENNNE